MSPWALKCVIAALKRGLQWKGLALPPPEQPEAGAVAGTDPTQESAKSSRGRNKEAGDPHRSRRADAVA
jgi:hypothetical protein